MESNDSGRKRLSGENREPRDGGGQEFGVLRYRQNAKRGKICDGNFIESGCFIIRESSGHSEQKT